MSRKTRIKEMLNQQNDANAIRLQNLNRQSRLQKLVNEYGAEDVALAAGYTDSTLAQYLRVKFPMNIAEKAVLQAEGIFKQLK